MSIVPAEWTARILILTCLLSAELDALSASHPERQALRPLGTEALPGTANSNDTVKYICKMQYGKFGCSEKPQRERTLSK